MRALFITNHYPPSRYGGGYMQLCEEVADALSARGHVVAVLTSAHCDGPEASRAYPVYRLLHIDPDPRSTKLVGWQFFVGRRRRERQDIRSLRRTVNEFHPQVIFIWHYLGLSRVMLREAEQLPHVAVAYYLADYLPEVPDEHVAFWHVPPVHWTAKLLKRPLAKLGLYLLAREGKPISLGYPNPVCVSEYVRQRLVSQGLIPTQAAVIHNGVDLSLFSPDARTDSTPLLTVLRCLIAGRVVADKGVHTAVQALADLKAQRRLAGLKLTILGDGPEGYVQRLQDIVSKNGLTDAVEFRPPVPRTQMPAVLAEHDILLLSSEFQEPLARAMQEAMAMRLLVIGTTTGGSGELLVHEQTGLAFEPGDHQSLAAHLARVRSDPHLMARLAAAGRRAVLEEFDIRHTVSRVENRLQGLVAGQETSL